MPVYRQMPPKSKSKSNTKATKKQSANRIKSPPASQAFSALMWAIAAVVATILAQCTIGAVPHTQSHTQSDVMRDIKLSPGLQAVFGVSGLIGVSSTAYALARSNWSKKKRFSVAALGSFIGSVPALIPLYHALNILTSLPHDDVQGFSKFLKEVHAIRNPLPQASVFGQVGAAFQQVFQIGISEQVQEAMDKHREYLPAVEKLYTAMDVMESVGVSFEGETGKKLQTLRSDLKFMLQLMHG